MIGRDWTVGMEVVCIDADWRDMSGKRVIQAGDPEFNEVCTIRQLTAVGEEIYIQIKGRLAWYEAAAFRPVQPRKTDISVFKRMLTGNKQRERV